MIINLSLCIQCFQKQTHMKKVMMDKIKWVYFLIGDDYLLGKYNNIWDNVSADINKERDGEPVYNIKFLKTRIKSYGNEITDFHDKEVHQVYSSLTCLPVISLDSALNKNGNYHLQVFQTYYS